MSLKDIFSEYGFVVKVDVSNLDASAEWYETKLGLVPDSRYDTKTWKQFNLPGIPMTAIGLNSEQGGAGTGGSVITFVVDNIKAARQGLIEQGITVGDINEVGDGVQLCFFKDPDGNSLGLRQNSEQQPTVSEIGDKS